MCSSDVTALKPILYCAPPQNGHYISQDTFSKMLLEKKGTISDAAATNTLLEEEATVLSVKGKKCFAQLRKLGAVVSFQLN